MAFTPNNPLLAKVAEPSAAPRWGKKAPRPTSGIWAEPPAEAGAAKNSPDRLCLHELFEAQVAGKPEAEALVAGADRLTYRELNVRANRVAHHLRSLGVGKEILVGLFLERTADMVVAMLGVLKSGGAYLPLDPAYPPDRLAFMLTDARVGTVLTQSSLVAKLRGFGFAEGLAPHPVCLDQDPAVARASGKNPESSSRPDDLAYVIYTSGSTGQPKGVMLEHRNAVSLVNWAGRLYGAHELAGMLGSVSISFDPSILDIFVPLSMGGKIILAQDTLALPGLKAAGEVRVITSVPSVVRVLLRMGRIPPEVETINLGGEPLSAQLVDELYALPHIKRVYDLFGPTEATTCSIFALRRPGQPASIGRPITGTEVFLFDEHLKPVPAGATGELFIGGAGVARGYLNRPDLTAEKFIDYAAASDRQVRLYRTGDLCRVRPDGNLEFLGRLDQQVKIRGFRIELGEIESALQAHPAVDATLVIAHADAQGERRLIAYVVPRPQAGSMELSSTEEQRLVAQLRSHLHSRLPAHMIPGTFVFLDHFELSANGKIQRTTLPPPVRTRSGAGDYHAPGTPSEISLGRIWAELLQLPKVGVNDDFFECGGDSLLGVALLVAIEEKTGVKLPVEALLQAPTVGRLAAFMDIWRASRMAAADSPWVVIQPHGNRPRLFLVHGVGGGMIWGYANLSRHLGPDQPVYAFKACRPAQLDEMDTIEKMAAYYVQELRRFQPEGPYALGGYCFGGNIAYQMARLLRAQGEQVGLLALLNASPPNSSYDDIRWGPRHLGRFLRNLGNWLFGFVQWGPMKQRRFLLWKAKALQVKLARWFRSAGHGATGPGVGELVDLSLVSGDERCLWESHVQALRRHRTQPYDGKVVLLRTRGHPLNCSYDWQCGWGELVAGGVAVRIIPGLHESLLEEPFVRVLAHELQAQLAAMSPVPPPSL